jgi:hypothetical protein
MEMSLSVTSSASRPDQPPIWQHVTTERLDNGSRFADMDTILDEAGVNPMEPALVLYTSH